MARVVVTSISGIEAEGVSGVKLDLTEMIEVQGPRIEPAAQRIDVEDPRQIAEAFGGAIRGTLQGFQQAGLIPRPSRPKVILFLTMKEYADLGSPGINEEFEASFYSSAYTVAPPLEEIGSFIRLRKVEPR